MFETFTHRRIETPEAVINLRHAGSGPPVLLLHGHPQTHAMWHKVAPRLAETYSVVDEVAKRALCTGARVLGARQQELPNNAPLVAILRYEFGLTRR